MTDKVIKSVRRVFEILELFEQERRPLAAKEISKRLNYPLMSAHALLKSMHELGYADFDPPTWSYTPSRAFIGLLEWAEEYLDRDANVLELVSALNDETLETVNLSQRVDTQVKIVHGLEGHHPVGVSVKVGTLMPLTQSLTGITALTCLDEETRRETMDLIVKEDPALYGAREKELIAQVEAELAEQPTVAGYDFFVRGISAVCMPIKSPVSGAVMVVGVVGPTDRIRANESKHRKTLTRLSRTHRVPVLNKKKPQAA
ncbi:MAG: helix-turn-helix domain-containing protein [Pseudomonadota bacterium]